MSRNVVHKNDVLRCFTWLLAIALALAAAAVAGKASTDSHFTTYIDRVPFYTGFETNLADVFQVGKQLSVIREINNPYDPNLLALYDGEDKVGYIPRESQQRLHALLEDKPNIKISVIAVYPSHPWQGVRIAIKGSHSHDY